MKEGERANNSQEYVSIEKGWKTSGCRQTHILKKYIVSDKNPEHDGYKIT